VVDVLQGNRVPTSSSDPGPRWRLALGGPAARQTGHGGRRPWRSCGKLAVAGLFRGPAPHAVIGPCSAQHAPSGPSTWERGPPPCNRWPLEIWGARPIKPAFLGDLLHAMVGAASRPIAAGWPKGLSERRRPVLLMESTPGQ